MGQKKKDGKKIQDKSLVEIDKLQGEIENLYHHNIELEKSEKELKMVKEKISKINNIFSHLGVDAAKNINVIVQQTCEILEGACSLYNRLDDEGKSLHVWSKYKAPPDLPSTDKPDGHICYEATIKGRNKPVVIEELRGTSFEKTDPNVKKYSLRSYLGYPVIAGEEVIGSLCIVDTKRRKFNATEINIVSTLAKALSFEEDRKQFVETLKKSEEKYRKIFEEFQDLYYRTDMDGIIKDLSPSVKVLSGYKYEELIGRSVLEFYKNKDDRYNFFGALIKTGSVRDYELILLGKGNRTIDVSINSHIIFDKDNNPVGVEGVIRDISERKRAEKERLKLEEKLQQVQKMEALGTLAGGIAHDFNNLLMGIQGRTSMMMMKTDVSHPFIDHLKGIEEYIKNASDLTKQLLGFAREGKYEVKPTDLNELVVNQNLMFGRTRKEIAIQEKFEKDLWVVEVDRGQMQQILLNLYVNAWQAMPGGGDLYIQTENVTVDEKYVKPYKVMPGKYVKISVTDTGVGIDEATKQRIFEPFFSTKEMKRGTGLGLASVYGIVKNHGGFLDVDSQKGEGTTFNIYLPASSDKEIVAKKESIPSEEIKKGSGTILLVDDEDFIITVGREMLEALGYKVLEAGNGEKAIEVFSAKRDKIDMVILDMIMPHMDGGEIFDRIKELDPEVKVLLSSGYSINGQASEILERGCRDFIQKPFSLKKLSQKISEILGTK